jgi:hypothetical protein
MSADETEDNVDIVVEREKFTQATGHTAAEWIERRRAGEIPSTSQNYARDVEARWLTREG